MQGSIIGITLRQRPAAVILGQGQCKTLFIHAGLPLQLLLSLVKSLDKPEPDAILAKLNEVVSGTSCIRTVVLTSRRSKKASHKASRCGQGFLVVIVCILLLHTCNNDPARCCSLPCYRLEKSLTHGCVLHLHGTIRFMPIACYAENQCHRTTAKYAWQAVCWLLLQVLSMPAQRGTVQKIK